MMLRKITCLHAALMLGFFLSATLGDATIYHVNKSGNDAGTCTAAQPCLTITRAKNLATQPGDIVQVAAGTYNERVTITANGSAAGGKITFRGHDGSGCPKTPVSDVHHPTGFRPAPTATTTGGFHVAGDFITVECFKIFGATGDALEIDSQSVHHVEFLNNHIDGNEGTTGTAIWAQNGDNTYVNMPDHIYAAGNYITRTHYGFIVKCSNCLFENNEVFALRNVTGIGDMDYARPWGDRVTFLRNYFHGARATDCTTPEGVRKCHLDCFQNFNTNGLERATNVTLDGNVCFNSHEALILANNSGTPGAYDNWVIQNNVLGYGPGDGHPWCMTVNNMLSVKIYNNTCIGGALQVRNNTQAEIKNNIFYDMGHEPYTVDGGGVITAAEKNLLFDPQQTYSQSRWPNDIINRDPLFKAVTNGDFDANRDFHLLAASPAIDAGLNIASVNSDAGGNPRPQGLSHDIGAYEGTSNVSRPAAPTNLRGTVR